MELELGQRNFGRIAGGRSRAGAGGLRTAAAGNAAAIGKFFAASSLLIALLAVVLAGKGVTALQEAGWIGLGLVRAPHIDWLGISPTWQSLLAQLVVLLVAVYGYLANARSARGHDAPA